MPSAPPAPLTAAARARPAGGPRAAIRARLPAYALYGEGAGAPAEPLHVEAIAERSRHHDWEIQPHRHAALLQILVIRRGRAEATLDGAPVDLRGPAAVTVPALAAHGFRFDPDVDGAVVTVADAHIDRLLQGRPALAATLRRLQAWPLAPRVGATRAVLRAAAALRAEYAADDRWRALALDTALVALLLALARSAPVADAAPAAGERALAHVQRLGALVDRRFRQQPTVAALAAEIGITPTQLNRACRQVLGRGALAVLHERLLREAQRELAYTTLAIHRIALDLGFCDAGYFTRFVQRHLACTPSAWRARLQGRHGR
jgi:AraC family transcriptional activator of pobA